MFVDETTTGTFKNKVNKDCLFKNEGLTNVLNAFPPSNNI